MDANIWEVEGRGVVRRVGIGRWSGTYPSLSGSRPSKKQYGVLNASFVQLSGTPWARVSRVSQRQAQTEPGDHVGLNTERLRDIEDKRRKTVFARNKINISA